MIYDICPAATLVTQDFGCTLFTSEWLAPWCKSGRYHSGIDLGMISGSLWHQPVYATRAGVVVAVGKVGDVDQGFWTYLGDQAVCINAGGTYLLYAHLDVAKVRVGQTVQVGDVVGLVGTRGNSTGPHLHLEARTDGARQNVWNNAAAVLDPRPFLNALAGGTAGSEVVVPQGGDELSPTEQMMLQTIYDAIPRLDLVFRAIFDQPDPKQPAKSAHGLPTDIRDMLAKLQATPPGSTITGTITGTIK